MTRSRKKAAITGWSCKESDKKDKQAANRKMRRKIRQNVLDNMAEQRKQAFSNVYNFAKDGKQYVNIKSPFYKTALRK